MAELRIAVDARPLCHPGTGIYRYTTELLTRMCRLGGDWYFYSPRSYDTAGFELPNVHHRFARLPASLRSSQLAHGLFPRWARRDRVAVFWGPRHQLPLPESAGLRQLVTIHDLVWKEYGETMRFPGRQIEDFFTPRALARAEVVVAVSQFTRSRLEHYFPQYAHKLQVVPGASMLRNETTAQRGAAGDYFLFVGTLEPRKNLPRLLRAYRRFTEAVPAARPLKIAGGSGWGQQDIGRLVTDLGLANRVQLLGKVDDATLAELYRGAYALLMPSLYEGFGLPVVEALSMGVPAIVSRNSALSEVAGSAGVLVDPESEPEILQALVAISTDQDLYQQLSKRTTTEAQRYDWNLSATTMTRLLMPC